MINTFLHFCHSGKKSLTSNNLVEKYYHQYNLPYLLAFIQVCKIVGWEIADNMRHENAVKALKMTLKQCTRGQKPIHHSDKGLQYCAKTYPAMLERRGMRISMTESYYTRNNGIAERVNGILKEEFLKHMDINASNIRQILETVINNYHSRRPHLSLGMLTPEEVHNGALPGAKLCKKYYLKVS